MSSELFESVFKLVTFAVATSLSLMFTSVLLRIPLGRGVVGLVLIGGLLIAILNAFAKYLTMLWMLSNKLSAFVVGRTVKPVASHATQSAEEA